MKYVQSFEVIKSKVNVNEKVKIYSEIDNLVAKYSLKY